MAYATQAQALSYCGRLAKTTTATSVPSTADLATFITDRANAIDAALAGRGLSTPVTAPAEFLAELAGLNARGAAGDMMQAAFITNDSNDRGAGALYLKEFTDRVNQLRSGIGVPVGLTTAEADLAPRYGATDPQADMDTVWQQNVQITPIFRLGRQF